MGQTRDRVAWVVSGLALAGAIGFGAKRFMAPHDPVGEPMQAGPPPGSEWIGRQFDPFRLRGVDGKPVDSSHVLGHRPAVIIFHGGQDSLFSTVQVAHLAALKEVELARPVVYVVSTDDPVEIAREVRLEWRRQHQSDVHPDFVFVGDDYGAFSRRYVQPPEGANPGIPGWLNRATFVVGRDRKILYAYVNASPKLQPSEKEVLEAIVRARKEMDAAAKR